MSWVFSEEIVGVSEMADNLNISKQTVSNWQVRYDDFPEPIAELRCGRLYNWPDVEAWHKQFEERKLRRL
jgi:chromosome partitioning protein